MAILQSFVRSYIVYRSCTMYAASLGSHSPTVESVRAQFITARVETSWTLAARGFLYMYVRIDATKVAPALENE